MTMTMTQTKTMTMTKAKTKAKTNRTRRSAHLFFPSTKTCQAQPPQGFATSAWLHASHADSQGTARHAACRSAGRL
eukprot:701959-Lingulodinium_polyedra.AAC.1